MRAADGWVAPGALLRLLARWYSLAAVYLLALAVFAPALFVDGDALRLLLGRVSASEFDAPMVRQLVVQTSALLGLISGALVAFSVTEVLGTPNGWLLPGARPKMLSGHLVILFIVVLIVSANAFARIGMQSAAMVVCLTPFWYAIGANWLTMGRWGHVSWPLMLLAIVLAFRPSWYAAAFDAGSLSVVLAVCGLVSAVVMLRSLAGAPWGRAVAVTSTAMHSVSQTFGLRLVPRRRPDETTQATLHAGARHTFRAWLDAAFVESGQTALRWLTTRVLFLGAYAAFIYGASAQIGLVSFLFVQHGLQLSGLFAYPLSRRQRADLQWVYSLLDTLTVGAVVWGVLFTLSAIDAPRFFADDVPSRVPWSLEVLAVICCAPIAQWPRAMGPLPLPAIGMRIIPMMLVMLGVVMLPRLLIRALGNPPEHVMLAILTAIAIGMQLLHLVALRYAYARRDIRRPA